MNDLNQTTREKLSQFIQRIERLESDKGKVAADIKETYSEAKVFGFDTKALRKVVALRKIEASEREEQEMLIELYMGVID